MVSVVPVAAIVLIEAPGGPVHWSPGLVAILVYNCVVTTALGYFLWGKVLSMMPAATAGQVLMLTPIGGFVLSLLIFGGTLTADVLISSHIDRRRHFRDTAMVMSRQIGQNKPLTAIAPGIGCSAGCQFGVWRVLR